MAQFTYLPTLKSNTASDDVDMSAMSAISVTPVQSSTVNAEQLPPLTDNGDNGDNAYSFGYGDVVVTPVQSPSITEEELPLLPNDDYLFGYGDADVVAGSGNTSQQQNADVPSDETGDERRNTSNTLPPNYYQAARQYNPLSKFATYNYQITLYAASPSAINTLWSSPSTAVHPGMRVVAQSGSTAPRAEPGSKDTAGTRTHQYDIHIDDLTIKTITSLPNAGSALYGSHGISFKIYEPYGITFIQELNRAVTELQQSEPIPGYADAKHMNMLLQPYVIGLRFYGFDENGKQLTASDFDTTVDNPSDPGAVFERFMIIQITGIEYTLNGKMVVYDVTAVNASASVGANSKETTLNANVSPIGGTIKEVLLGAEDGRKNSGKGFLSYINAQQEKIKNDSNFNEFNVFDIKFEEGFFDNVSIVNRREYSAVKKSAMGTDVKNSADANIKTSQGATVDTNTEAFQFKQGDSIISCISQVIKQSMYVKNALSTYESQNPEPDAIKNASPSELAWFRIIPTIQIKAYDTTTNKFAHHITYHVRRYKVPYIKTPSVEKRAKFRGPVKTYKYWFGGENDEVVSYEHQFKTLFYVHAQNGTKEVPSYKNPIHPITTTKPPNTETTNSLQNKDVSAIEADLFSPGDLALAKLKILGDPDYLVEEASRTKYFIDSIKGTPLENDTTRFDPIGGDSFVQIIFMSVSDYSENTDVMTVLNNVSFSMNTNTKKTKYPGIMYQIKEVTSQFSGGKFVQDLDLFFIPYELLETDEDVAEQNQRDGDDSRTTPVAASTNTTQKTTSTAGVSSDATGD